MDGDRRIWHGKDLDQLTEDELQALAGELTEALDEDDPMVREVRERLRAYRQNREN
jgi:hypothetical protein